MKIVSLIILSFILFVQVLRAQIPYGDFQGQKQSGMASTGTGLLLDNAALFYNPGSVCFLDSLRGISLGSGFIMARTVFRDPLPGNYTSSSLKSNSSRAGLYAVFKFKNAKKWNLGLGIYNPQGNKMLWENDWLGQFLIREYENKALFFQPTLSFKLGERWGFGAGFIIASGDLYSRKALAYQNQNSEYGEAEINGTGEGFGFNTGLYFKANENLSFGINYRSAVTIKIKNGKALFDVPSSLADEFPESRFVTNIYLPASISLGTGYKSQSGYMLTLDINYRYIGYDDTVRIDYTENTDYLRDELSYDKNSDEISIRAGIQFKPVKKWVIRAGTFVNFHTEEFSPRPENPQSDGLGFTAGASYRLTKKLHIDASLAFVENLKRTVNNDRSGFNGIYKTRTFIPGVALEYVF